MDNGFPKNFIINCVVAVYYNMAHIDDVAPWYFVVIVDKIL